MVSSTKHVTGAAAAVTAGSLVFAGASLARADSTTDSNAAGSSTSSAQADRGRGGHAHTEVTGDEATKVTKAVTTTDSAVTVQSVRKDPDGSYDVMGTKNGERVMVEVSAYLMRQNSDRQAALFSPAVLGGFLGGLAFMYATAALIKV